MKPFDEELARAKMIRRKTDAHKGDFGRVLIFAGSVGMAGAAVLCGRAALKAGAGLVSFLLPSLESPIYTILQTAVPEAMCISFDDITDFSKYDTIAAGPGLGKKPETERILRTILETYEGKLVLDADALNMISASAELSALTKGSKAQLVMTPHVGEAQRLVGEGSREEMFAEISRQYSAVVVMKGAGSIVGTADDAYINTTGNPGMATGGSGDVLTGMIAALCGQGYSAADAALLGTWLHGKAGDMAAETLSEISVTSSEIVNFFVPAAFKLIYPANK